MTNLAKQISDELFYDGPVRKCELQTAIGTAEASIRWHRQAMRRLICRGPVEKNFVTGARRGVLRAIKAEPDKFSLEQKHIAWANFDHHKRLYRYEQDYLRKCLDVRWAARKTELLAAE